jgi:dihydropteroate synthase
MNEIYSKFFDSFEIGDGFPTVIMGVLNLSPESFYKGSVYEDQDALQEAMQDMINNGAKILDLGARSTAPWSKKISIKEEIDRIVPAMEAVCSVVPKEIIITIDTQYAEVAEKALEISQDHDINVMINDVSCLKTDPSLADLVVKKDLPIILMASKKVPGDLCSIDEIMEEFRMTIKVLNSKGYDENKIILDPGIGHWIEEKTYEYDLKIIGNLSKLKNLNKPILVAISRKSFIGTTLNLPEPEKRLNGSLSATAIAVYNGAHVVRTHDVNEQLLEIVKMAEEIRRNQ